MNKKIVALAAVVLVVIIVAVAYWQLVASVPSAEARPIRIGLVAPYSSPIGQDMDRAARMAVDEINAAGGIWVSSWNTRVEVVLYPADTKGDAPGDAVVPVERVVLQDQVDLLIGGYGSSATLANEKVAIDNRVPYIITGASNRLVTRRGPQANYGGLPEGDPNRIDDAEGMSYVFHYCTTTYHYSKTVVDFFAEVMKPMIDSQYGFDTSRQFRLAVIYKNDAFGQGVIAASKYWIENQSLPIEIVAERKLEPATIAFQADLTAIKATNPDAVFVVHDPDKTPDIIKQGQNDVGLKSVYIVIENNEDPAFFHSLGQAGEGHLLESKFAPFAGPPYYLDAVGDYVTAFKERNDGTIPGMMGADTYDAFYIAKDAIERAGTVDKKAVRDAIETTNMDQMLIMTETGKIQFSIGVDYHEILPVTFIEQLVWLEDSEQLVSVIVWPSSVPGAGTIKHQDFALPADYQPGSS
jgi:branched-chain amino acid transport system substrate-binding protein